MAILIKMLERLSIPAIIPCMIDASFDPARIRQAALIEENGNKMVQFMGIGDKHKMIKHVNGHVEMIKLVEQGKEYNYRAPVPLDEALAILDQGHYHTHRQMARDIRDHLGL